MKHWTELLPQEVHTKTCLYCSTNRELGFAQICPSCREENARNEAIQQIRTALTGKVCLIPSVEDIEKEIVLGMYNTVTPLPKDCDCGICTNVGKTAQSIHDMLESNG